jgi:hypothetical protein
MTHLDPSLAPHERAVRLLEWMHFAPGGSRTGTRNVPLSRDVLTNAVAASRLAPRDAELSYLSRIAGQSAQGRAAERGLHAGTIRKRRHRAETTLVLAGADVA